MHQKRHFRKWLILAPLGLVLMGGGLSLIGDAILYKASGAPFWEWFGYGTFSLAVFNSGVSVFGQAVVHRVHLERIKMKDKE